MSLISCQDLSFSYQGRTVLSQVNFSLEAQDYLAILGENGSGKSTLLKGLLGLKKPDCGQIVLAPELSRRDIGYLPQQSAHQADFPATVEEIVLSAFASRLAWRFRYSREQKAKAAEAMQKLAITDLGERSFADLSGGQKQRVLMARALAAGQKLLILDEPFAGLDPLVSQDLYGLLEEVRAEGLAIIIVSHDLHATLYHANKILHLGSRQLFFGSVEAYKESAIGKLFLGLAQSVSDPAGSSLARGQSFSHYCNYCDERQSRTEEEEDA